MFRAKLRCSRKTPDANDPTIARVKFEAAYGDSPENKSWAKWTSSAVLEMQITNPDVLAQIHEGDEYLVDFAPAETKPTT